MITIASALAAVGAPSVSIAVVQNGHIAYAHAFGKSDIAKGRAAEASTRYAVGSISKQFTAAGLLLEQEQGKVSLDDKVAKYYPDLTRANEITIRELLSHTSGYEDYAPQDYLIPDWTKPITPDEILNRWAKKPLNFDPGTRWQYSNTNYRSGGQNSGEGVWPKSLTLSAGAHSSAAWNDDCRRLRSTQRERCYSIYALCTRSTTRRRTRGERLVFRSRRVMHDGSRSGALGHRVSSKKDLVREVL